MKTTLRWLAIGSLVVTIGGCSGNTELSGSSGSVLSTPQAAQGDSKQDPGEDTAKQNARKVFAAALATAKENDQRVFVHVGAPW